MRSLPRRRGPPARNSAAPRQRQAAQLPRARNRAHPRNGPGHARRFHLRPRPDRLNRPRIRLATLEHFSVMSEPVIENRVSHAAQLDAPQPTIPLPRGPIPQAPPPRDRRSIDLTIDGRSVSVPEGSTILDAAKKIGIA